MVIQFIRGRAIQALKLGSFAPGFVRLPFLLYNHCLLFQSIWVYISEFINVFGYSLKSILPVVKSLSFSKAHLKYQHFNFAGFPSLLLLLLSHRVRFFNYHTGHLVLQLDNTVLLRASVGQGLYSLISVFVLQNIIMAHSIYLMNCYQIIHNERMNALNNIYTV